MFHVGPFIRPLYLLLSALARLSHRVLDEDSNRVPAESIAIEKAEVEALSIGKPRIELVGVADIEYSLAGHFGAHRDR